MFLDPIRIARPDLQCEVRELVHIVCGQPEGQQLSLSELIRILGIRVAPWLREDLVRRGDLHLGERTFVNEGPPVRRKVRLMGIRVDLDIAAHLRGRITRFQESFQLRFERDHSVSVHKFLFHVELAHLDINQERIFVDFTGAQDLFIDLR